MSPQPEQKTKENKAGRPEGSGFTDVQYNKFLDEMMPFLKLGQTLNSAIDDAGLTKHKTVIYEKYRLNDYFAQQIDTWQSLPGKLANNILVKRVMDVDEKIKQGRAVTKEDIDDVKFVAEKHRTSQPYFVNRTETKEVKDSEIGKVIDNLNNDDDVTERVTQPVVATDAPVQDQGQAGKDNHVQTQPDSNAVPSGEGQA